jgi:hypothetical protein
MDGKAKIVLTRESVCQGDDVFAPNKEVIYLSENKNITELIEIILAKNYLAKISGGQATWVMKNEGAKLAVIAQQWKSAKFLINEKLPIGNLKKNQDFFRIHFDYLTQQDPEIVYHDLASLKK